MPIESTKQSKSFEQQNNTGYSDEEDASMTSQLLYYPSSLDSDEDFDSIRSEIVVFSMLSDQD